MTGRRLVLRFLVSCCWEDVTLPHSAAECFLPLIMEEKSKFKGGKCTDLEAMQPSHIPSIRGLD